MKNPQAEKQLKAYQAQITENEVKNQLIDYLRAIGWLVLRINSGARTETDSQTGQRRHYKFCTWQARGYAPSSAGVSDILAIEPGGRLWAIECKRPGKLANLTQSQRDFQEAVRERGGVAIVADSQGVLIEAIIKYGGRFGA